MADDREVLREIWEGKLPVSFTLASDEVESEKPESIYVSIELELRLRACQSFR